MMSEVERENGGRTISGRPTVSHASGAGRSSLGLATRHRADDEGMTMASSHRILLLSLISAATLAATAVRAQDVPAAAQPAAAELKYQVYAVKGRVSTAAIGVDPKLRDGWRPVKRGEYLTSGQQIRVSLRSAVKLVAVPADPPTVIMIEKVSLISISELRFENNAAKSRIGLAYGAIRVGVVEGTVRSDMEIQCPVAVLSKKGTEIFRMEYRNGRWKMSLSERGRGQIQAIQMFRTGIVGVPGSRRTRNVFPGQSVTDLMARTIETTLFDRQINVGDIFGIQGMDLKINTMFGSGLGLLLKGQNPIGLLGTTQTDGGTIGTQPTSGDATMPGGDGSQLQLQQAINGLRDGTRVHGNPAGDFGIGQIPINLSFGPTGKIRTAGRTVTCKPGLFGGRHKLGGVAGCSDR